ncbi:MAG: hypothetical protein ABI608_10690 [Rhizomicrobium sp.]
MGRRRWKAGQNEEAEPASFLQRFRKPIIIAAILAVAAAFFVYRFSNSRYQYGDARSAYNRALAECMRDRTRVDGGGDAIEEAADSCVRDTPPPPSAGNR